MANPKIWSNVQVAMQSAISAAVAISSINKSTGLVTTGASHGITEGDYFLLEVQGMHQVDNRVFRATTPLTSTTLTIEGETLTDYDDFSSGNIYKLTYGTTLAVVRSLSASGGDPNFIDVTTIHDTVAKQIPGVASAIAYSLENIWDVSDAGLVALKAASDATAQRAMKFQFSDGQIMVFRGYVSAPNLPGGSAQDLVTSPASITMYGTPTYYAS